MTDRETLASIKSQTLALIAEVTAQPKPSYTIDGQAISWAEYLAQLRATIDWCDQRLALLSPCEVRTQGWT